MVSPISDPCVSHQPDGMYMLRDGWCSWLIQAISRTRKLDTWCQISCRVISRGGREYGVSDSDWSRASRSAESIFTDRLWETSRDYHLGTPMPCDQCRRAAFLATQSAHESSQGGFVWYWKSELLGCYEHLHAEHARGWAAEWHEPETLGANSAGVYVVGAANSDVAVVKVGKAVNIKRRLRDLNGLGCPVELVRLKGWMSVGRSPDVTKRIHTLERWLHVRFADARTSGEWFNVSVNDIQRAVQEFRAA
jgi:hypothetical protein